MILDVIFSILILQAHGLEKIEVLGKQPENNEPSWYFKSSAEDQFLRSVNLNFSSGANRSRFFQVRGIGEHSQYDTFRSPVVGFFYEDIDISDNPQALFLGFDQPFSVSGTSEALEWGSSAMGGAVSVKACRPGDCDQHQISLLAQNRNTSSLSGSLPLALTKDWRLLLRASRFESDGFQFNNYLRQPTGFRKENYFEFHQFVDFKKWSIETHSLMSLFRNGYDHFSHDNSQSTYSDRPGHEDLDFTGHSLKVERRGRDFDLQIISSFTSSKNLQSFDEDWGNNEFWSNLPGWNQSYDYFSEYRMNHLKFHQKIRLDFDRAFFGFHGFYFDEELTNQGFMDGDFRSVTEGRSKREGLALLGGYKIFSSHGEQWELGGRLENHRMKLKEPENLSKENFLYVLESKYSNPLGIMGSQWLVGRSYRAGGFNLDNLPNEEERFFEPEDFYFTRFDWPNLSIGSGQRWSLFYHFRNNQQLRTSFQDDPTDPASFSTITQSAGQSEAFGLEVEQTIQNRFLFLRFSLGGLYSYFKEYHSPEGSKKGRLTPYAPLYSFQILGRVKFNSRWSFEGLYYGKGSFYFSNSHNRKSAPFELLDLSINYHQSMVNLSIYAKNILDRSYAQRGFYFSNSPPEWEPQLYTQPSSPRVFGAQASFYF